MVMGEHWRLFDSKKELDSLFVRLVEMAFAVADVLDLLHRFDVNGLDKVFKFCDLFLYLID